MFQSKKPNSAAAVVAAGLAALTPPCLEHLAFGASEALVRSGIVEPKLPAPLSEVRPVSPPAFTENGLSAASAFRDGLEPNILDRDSVSDQIKLKIE